MSNMDEDSNQSSSRASGSSISQQHRLLLMDESKHCESDSEMTLMDYDDESDSELPAGDTLRMDEDSAEEKSNEPNAVTDETKVGRLSASPFEFENAVIENPETKISNSGQKDSDGEMHTNKISGDRRKLTALIDSDTDDDEHSAKKSDGIIKREKPTKKMIPRLFDSDSENGYDENLRSDHIVSDLQTSDLSERNKADERITRLATLVDSDSSSSSENGKEDNRKKILKKVKTKKDPKKPRDKKKAKDLLASLNLDFSDDSRSRSPVASDESDGSQNSGSNSESEDESSPTTKNQRKISKNHNSEDRPQRMTAKAAMEQMKVIQSESQRMTRESQISVPYHRPKQHTLQEFLNRRNINKPAQALATGSGLAEGRRKLAAAIKMTPEQLAAFAKRLEDREREAIEFFKSVNENDSKQCADAYEGSNGEKPNSTNFSMNSSELHQVEQVETQVELLEDKTGEGLVEALAVTKNSSLEMDNNVSLLQPAETELETLRVSDTEEDPLDALVNKTHENVEQLLSQQQMEPIAGTSRESQRIDYDLFPSESNSNNRVQRAAELVLTDNSIPTFPTLKGGPDMVIDLDSGDVKPKTPSGADILFQRFAKCSGKKSKKTHQLSILNADNGIIALDTVHLVPLEKDDRDPNGKEPIPGAAYMKLKQSLREKMERKRREALEKREQEMQQAKKLDDDDDEEEEEILEDDDMDDEEKDDDDIEYNEVELGNGLLDVEADVDEDGEKENDELIDDEETTHKSEESSEESSDEEPENTGEKKKSRIIAAFEDSDDEAVVKDVGLLEGTSTNDLFSYQKESEFLSGGNKNNLWKNTESAPSATQVEQDLLALCSGRFVDTQNVFSTQGAESLCTTQTMTEPQSGMTITQSEKEPQSGLETSTNLFTQPSETPQISDTQLIELCSGTFASQAQDITDIGLTQQKSPSTELVKK
ncbi:claspin-like, partial [Uranotaenia lowii]|uniref:claspin-like n=1 Tax=Uranotaenia lowii TaxID=190385 RepID=UPI0024788FA9